MDVDVHYFAAAREAAGCQAEAVLLEGEATVAALERRLVALHPDLAPLMAAVRFAVGEHFVDREAVLEPGDLVALIPPVSGG